MKGILLAGGHGTRLYPLTLAISKQLLPVYDKPMIYYPLSTLLNLGIKDILIISTPRDTPKIQELFGTGAHLGINLSYKVQEEPKGIPQAFTLGADFIGKDDVCLMLGDNIFYSADSYHFIKEALKNNKDNKATLFAYSVSDPERSGVLEFDQNCDVISLEEKPQKPKSHFVVTGLFYYPNDVVQKAGTLRLSQRGEYEITDLSKLYLSEKRLRAVPIDDSVTWLDAGTVNSLLASASLVARIHYEKGLNLGCVEEVAYNQGFINHQQFQKLINQTAQGPYQDYLKHVANVKQAFLTKKKLNEGR